MTAPGIRRNVPVQLPPETLAVDDNLTLVRAERGDADMLYALVDENREFLGRSLGFARRFTPQKAATRCEIWYSDMQNGRGSAYWVTEMGEKIGLTELWFNPMTSSDSWQLEYWLAEPARGRGVMSRAARRLIDYAFEERDIREIELLIVPSNPRSQAVARRIGAVHHAASTADPTIDGCIWRVTNEQ